MITTNAALHTKNKELRDDIRNVLILILTASALGIYLIATTVLISKDGVTYINLARRLSGEPLAVVRDLPVGYPFLVFASHKLAAIFGAGSSVLSWTCSAQGVTLLCRVLALIPLYFIGKLLVGSTRSFWAIMILTFLPNAAQLGSDTLRDWPHMLFLASGLWLLLRGVREGAWWTLAGAGMAAGLGHIIRPECGQVVVYGASWFLMRLVVPEPNTKRPALVGGLAVLLLGFADTSIPYMAARDQILPQKLREYIGISAPQESEANHDMTMESASTTQAAFALGGTIRAIEELTGQISDSLMYYFVPALVLGVYAHIRRRSVLSNTEKFFIPAFVLLNVLMMIMLYSHWGYLSRRHCLPLVAVLIFYVPEGLEIIARRLDLRFSKAGVQDARSSQRWFFILLAVGAGICARKLLSSLGYDKQGCREASEGLRQNSRPTDVVAVPDLRISFYAERKGISYTTEIPEGTDYIVRIFTDQDEEMRFAGRGRKAYSAKVDIRKKNKKRVAVYHTI